MPAFTSISKFAVVAFLILASGAYAADPKSSDKRQDDDDFSETPYTEYGEFNEEADEAAETRFFQYGRFFGVSVGLGFQSVLGNRGFLYQGGFPMLDFKLHYWFDFNFAIDLGVTTATHFFETDVQNQRHVDVNMVRVGVDLKYYFDTKNLSAPISFANPYLLLGVGSFSKTQVSENATSTAPSDSSFALSAGGGLEFALSPRKTYFEVEGKLSFPTFTDTYTTLYQQPPNNLENLTGPFYSVTGAFLFTW